MRHGLCLITSSLRSSAVEATESSLAFLMVAGLWGNRSERSFTNETLIFCGRVWTWLLAGHRVPLIVVDPGSCSCRCAPLGRYEQPPMVGRCWNSYRPICKDLHAAVATTGPRTAVLTGPTTESGSPFSESTPSPLPAAPMALLSHHVAIGASSLTGNL